MNEIQKISYTSDGDESLSLRVYNVGYEQCKSLHQWGPGVRKFYLIHHIVSGKGRYMVGNKSFEINAGNTFLIYPNIEITYIADKDDPWEYYWVGFSGNDARIILNQTDFSEDSPVILTDLNNQFENYIMDIYKSQGIHDSAKIKMSGYLLLGLSLLVEQAKQTKGRQDITNVYTIKAMEYIEYNHAGKLSVQDIADYIGISRSQLYRVFMDTYQKSPIQMILEFRIRMACELLKNSKLSIGSVGFSVGFEDNLYFSRAFRKVMGISPREYIKSIYKNM